MLKDQHDHDGMITHLEPDILECEVKWALESITLNKEFQRIARRDKKAFLSNQCEEIEENNKMGKTRDFFKNIGGIKWTFYARMNMIKDRNAKALKEV